MTQPADPVPAQPAAPTPQPSPAPAPAPTYVPPPGLAAPQAPPPGPTYVPPVPMPTSEPEPDDDGRDVSRLPQWAQDQLVKLKNENGQRRIEARTALVAQHAYAAASQLGTNPAALLGSTAFTELAKTLNPNTPDFPTKLTEAIHATVKANPWMAAQPAPAADPPPPPAASGGDFSAGTGAGEPITEEQLSKMSPTAIAKAHAEGRLKHLM